MASGNPDPKTVPKFGLIFWPLFRKIAGQKKGGPRGVWQSRAIFRGYAKR